ncbi:MAG: hypothetical protein OD815_001034 [Candidatus Alkanophagales archaeon MCA70_species_2]|nr:hypothetical protein [Candidatus Alkanophaga liquidiphilum]
MNDRSKVKAGAMFRTHIITTSVNPVLNINNGRATKPAEIPIKAEVMYTLFFIISYSF